MSKPVKDLVSKLWAASASEILTRSSPDITTVFTRLLTMSLEHEQKLKSQAAVSRCRTALQYLNDGLKFGWAHGFNGTQTRFTRPAKKKPIRRVGALLPLAISLGETIGKAQAAKINNAHRNADSQGLGLHHEHATKAS